MGMDSVEVTAGAVNVEVNVPFEAVVPVAGLKEPPPAEVKLTVAPATTALELLFVTWIVTVVLAADVTVAGLASIAAVNVETGTMLAFSTIFVEFCWINVMTLRFFSFQAAFRVPVALISVVSPATRLTGWLTNVSRTTLPMSWGPYPLLTFCFPMYSIRYETAL